MAHLKILLCLFVSLSCASAARLSLYDSLSCEVTGGAALHFFHGSGPKATEDGLIICGFDHGFTQEIHAAFALRGAVNGSLPLIEEAALQWKRGPSALEAGFVSQRYGFDKIYRPHSIFNFLFDKPVLWDEYGFGSAYCQGITSCLNVTAATSINAKENGQAHLLLTFNAKNLESSVLGGFQSYTIENQDNSFTSGIDVTARWDSLLVHCTAKYVDYFGYGHAANPTMVPGETITGFLELSYVPISGVSLNTMSYYFQTTKRFEHEFFFEGLEGSWMIFRHYGLGGGVEWQKDDDIITIMPRIFARIVPFAAATELQISMQPTFINHTVTSYRLAGEIWIRL
jgi:hypothetical protein